MMMSGKPGRPDRVSNVLLVLLQCCVRVRRDLARRRKEAKEGAPIKRSSGLFSPVLIAH